MGNPSGLQVILVTFSDAFQPEMTATPLVRCDYLILAVVEHTAIHADTKQQKQADWTKHGHVKYHGPSCQKRSLLVKLWLNNEMVRVHWNPVYCTEFFDHNAGISSAKLILIDFVILQETRNRGHVNTGDVISSLPYHLLQLLQLSPKLCLWNHLRSPVPMSPGGCKCCIWDLPQLAINLLLCIWIMYALYIMHIHRSQDQLILHLRNKQLFNHKSENSKFIQSDLSAHVTHVCSHLGTADHFVFSSYLVWRLSFPLSTAARHPRTPLQLKFKIGSLSNLLNLYSDEQRLALLPSLWQDSASKHATRLPPTPKSTNFPHHMAWRAIGCFADHLIVSKFLFLVFQIDKLSCSMFNHQKKMQWLLPKTAWLKDRVQ